LYRRGRCQWQRNGVLSAKRGETQREPSESGAYRALGQEENVGREMVGAICSLVKLSKCVGAVVTSGVDGSIGALCLDLPEE